MPEPDQRLHDPPAGHDHHEMARQSSTTGLTAFAAIVAGLGFDATIAAIFGAGPTTDALFVAFRLPLGIVVVLVLVGSQALVPVFATWFVRHEEDEALRRVTGVLVSVVVIATAAGVALAALADPLTRVTAPGLPRELAATSAGLLRVLSLAVPLTAAAEVLRAFLNARRSFAAPAAMNVVLNGVAAVIVLSVASTGGVATVAWAYVVGATARLAYASRLASHHGFRCRGGAAWGDPDVGLALALCVRPLLAGALMPLARVGEQVFASFLPSGSISILNYAYRVVMAIGGTVFFRSISLTLVPRLTEAQAHADWARLRRTTLAGIRLLVFAAVPLTVFLLVLGRPLASMVFVRGSFGHADALRLGSVIAVLALGLVGSALQRGLLAPALAALDMRTPLRNTLVGALANLALLPVLVIPLRGSDAALLGVAAANVAAQYVMAVHAQRRLPPNVPIAIGQLWRAFRPVAMPSAIALALMLGLGRALAVDATVDRLDLVLEVGAIGAIGLVAFILVLRRASPADLHLLVAALRSPTAGRDTAAEVGNPSDKVEV